MNKYTDIPTSFLTDTVLNSIVSACYSKVPNSSPIKSFIVLETFSLVKNIAALSSIYPITNMVYHYDQLKTKENDTTIDELKPAGLDFLQLGVLLTFEKVVLPLAEVALQIHLVNKLDIQNQFKYAIYAGLIASKMVDTSYLDSWSGLTDGIVTLIFENYTDSDYLETIVSKYKNSTSSANLTGEQEESLKLKAHPGAQILSQSDEYDGYIQVNYLDPQDKKLCLDKVAQEEWLKVAANENVGVIRIDSRSIIETYDECPNDTIEVNEFINGNEELSKVHYFIPLETDLSTIS
ncbi:hypothetical protein I862_01480 [endosymbiont of Acanthamoeba sp. UWC8]|uniref:hypothetical protein n=1 Tax=endosymbiont of Acanthamoeba sp. UWC8 TaxID=86106 RepID=UPI0004D16C6E|nr:hypothetical protein [endosymbiont of Acanthamoeba sp. UWC8]AIF80859.1 hypothetical protein I862_01480 [endosymbiont of Acanthamoeba sp. UWC8]